MKPSLLILLFLYTLGAVAEVKWANCFLGPQSEPIEEVFWKSDMSGSNGPDYLLKSGQKFSNLAGLCRSGQVLEAKQWTREIQKINPAKTIHSLTTVNSPEEFQKFLTENGVQVDDRIRLRETVHAYLSSEPLPTESHSMVPGKASHPIILVGASQTEALMVLSSSDGKQQYANLMHLKLK